ncbi:MAG: DEAD/DEAH box helicase family protein [Victivallales bacterium]|nr:DEAD/DEAH box helicase family protein [Victivallales bacterium]
MKSVNFEFLRDKYEAFADIGGYAEAYVYTDPSGCLARLRQLAEVIVKDLFSHYRLSVPFKYTLNDQLNDTAFTNLVDRAVVMKLDFIRKNGNKAVHSPTEKFTSTLSMSALKETHRIARWFYVTVEGADPKDLPEFVEPEGQADETAALKRKNRSMLAQMMKQEARMKKVLEELEEARAKAEEAAKSEGHEYTDISKISPATIAEIQSQTKEASNALLFSEAETRDKLIDVMLKEAGWDVAPGEKSTGEVRKELEVHHQPTEFGIGYADYVLFNEDSKPLAVIEAKKTSVDSEAGRSQAMYYAEGLAKDFGCKPVVYYTNGIDVFMIDNVDNDVPRKVYGFYSKDSLQSCVFQSKERCTIKDKLPNRNIIDRDYQQEAVKRVCESFSDGKRKALIVQSTGTGKTRVAMGLCELMLKNNWAKRILFLCDRRELRKQANNAFKNFLDQYPRTYLKGDTYKDKNKRIYLATYPAMMKCYQNFDIGFFDLIIADESHRSIYNRYREIFMYFDSRQLGLTATPINGIYRDTYKLFGCEEKNPTFNYEYDKAVEEGFLCPARITKMTSQFLRDGLKYSEMNEVQRQQADEQDENAEAINYEGSQVNKSVYNRDTDRHILRNLMENGIRIKEGSRLGKTIVFACNHKHAEQLYTVFCELYPQYGADFCKVIDNYSSRAEQDIDEFKDTSGNRNLTIAISVDMLDTGIDVPEVVNLVFAKPVKSYAKFWQMIGRGTRLCENLFGPGQHKQYFQIFDHYGNFDYFEELEEDEVQPLPEKSLQQKLFENRIELAQEAVKQQDLETFNRTIKLIQLDIANLPETSCAVKDRWREKRSLENIDLLKKFEALTVEILKNDIAPLMQWRNIEGEVEAFDFDNKCTRLQTSIFRKDSYFDSGKANIIKDIGLLPVTINAVKNKIESINDVKNSLFWQEDNLSLEKLEWVRNEFRGLMKYKQAVLEPPASAKGYDISDGDIQTEAHKTKLIPIDKTAYRVRVNGIFAKLFEDSPALKKIRNGEPVSDNDITTLAKAVSYIDPDFDIYDLLEIYPNKADRIDNAIRQVIGYDPKKVEEFFSEFINNHPDLSSHQMRFLDLLKGQIREYGSIELDKLWEAPFTRLNSLGIDGIFSNPDDTDEIIDIVKGINEYVPAE